MAEFETRILSEPDDGAWDRLLRRHPAARSVVPKFEEKAGWTTHRIGLLRGAELVGGAIFHTRRIPRLPWRLGRCTCAMTGPERHGEMFLALLGEIERFARSRSVLEVEHRLRIPANDALPGFEHHREIAAALAGSGYRELAKREGSYIVRIDREDEAILASFASDCRSHIRKARKEGATVEAATDVSAFEEFWQATLAMVERKQAPGIPRSHLVDGLSELWRAGHVQLFRSLFGGRTANLAVTDTLGIPTDIAAARAPASVGGAVPSGGGQLLQFEIMRRMRDQGRVWYDLGGCEGPEPVEGHPNFGVWKYKSRYKGAYVQFLPWFRKARNRVAGRFLAAVHRMRGDAE